MPACVLFQTAVGVTNHIPAGIFNQMPSGIFNQMPSVVFNQIPAGVFRREAYPDLSPAIFIASFICVSRFTEYLTIPQS